MGFDDLADLSSVTFNQDGKSLAVGHQTGYLLYSMGNCADASTIEPDGHSDPKLHDAIIVERLFNSSLVVIVSRTQPRIMYVYHSQSKNMICDYKYGNTVLAVKLNRERVVVCLEDSLYIYNLKDMKMMHSICDTPANKHGLIDLSSNQELCYLAYPGSTTNGTVHIFDAKNLTSVNTFLAHNSPLASLKFNADGSKLATAGGKGTVIRVFSMPKGEKIFEFRRGSMRNATIYSMCFSADSNYLCTSSNTETVHVFKLEKHSPSKEEQSTTTNQSNNAGWLGYLQQAANYLPMNELSMLERSFASAHLPSPGSRNVSAMPTLNGVAHLLVATTEGYLYCYRIEPDGGECHLIRQHRIGPSGSGVVPNGKPRSPSGSITSNKSQKSADNVDPPNPDDVGDFPPMSHTNCTTCQMSSITIDSTSTMFSQDFESDITSFDPATGCLMRTFTCTGQALNTVIISFNFDQYTQPGITTTSVTVLCNAQGQYTYMVDPANPLSLFVVTKALCEDIG
ncbi:unnamed protein product, partial [Mesorhabditis belari]|uniref:WD repeat domain phosphoinositide-interacting protein 2 n=1 Tax=Mesorhabditis belari TaxID=2138241 RepID=A0AAF3F2D9_9BILA